MLEKVLNPFFNPNHHHYTKSGNRQLVSTTNINVSPWQARNQQMPDTPKGAFKFSIWKVRVTHKFLAFIQKKSL